MEIRISEYEGGGYIVHAGREMHHAIFSLKEIDDHIVLFDNREKVIGVEDSCRRDKALERLLDSAKSYASGVMKRNPGRFETVALDSELLTKVEVFAVNSGTRY